MSQTDDEQSGQVIDGSSVTPVKFVRDGNQWTNADSITLNAVDGVIDLDGLVVQVGPWRSAGVVASCVRMVPVAEGSLRVN